MPDIRRTACSRDCPDACSLLVTVEDGRATMLRGDPDDPVTKGFLCERTSRFLDRQYDPERFVSPMLRRDGALVPIDWDEALDLAAERLLAIREESGGAAILHYKSGGSLGILKNLSKLLFERFGPVSLKRGDICSGAGDAAQEKDFGLADGHDIFDVLNAKTILVWGKNVHVSSVHLLPVLREAKANGATLIGMDPVRTRMAEMCDLFVQPRPGADHALAMGVARWLFDHDAVDAAAREHCDNFEAFAKMATSRSLDDWAAACDVPAADVARIAEAYGTVKPGAILVGWGLGRRRNGSLTTRALDALGAITGNLGVAGGGVSYDFARTGHFDLSFIGDVDTAPRTFRESRLGPELLAADDPPVRAIWVSCGNPVSMLPDSGAVAAAFDKSEFNVVVDTHPTDTTDHAHLVLPTLTLLEDDDVVGAFGNHWIRESHPVLAPPEGPRHELEIMQGLAARLGLADVLAGSIEDWKRRVLADLVRDGLDREKLREGPQRSPSRKHVLFEGGAFPTSSGKAQLLDQTPLPAPEVSADYPLTLMATSTSKAQSSQWSVKPPPGPPEAKVHPEAANGFADGDTALLESRVASMPIKVRHDDTMRRDVIWMAKGGMLRDGQCANLLVAAVESDDGGGAAYYDELVRLRTTDP